VLDANAAWTAEVSLSFLEILRPYRHRIYMLEQPWPVDFLRTSPGERSWAEVRTRYNDELGILLFADESMSTVDDILPLRSFVNGVNVKLEKAGGFRGALAAIDLARECGLEIWCGVMVGSPLGSSATAHLLGLVSEGADLDGSLLVTPSSSIFTGGVVWAESSQHGQVFGSIGWPKSSSVTGIGCLSKVKEPVIDIICAEFSVKS
jgi:L-alanine-DL-glutamate epimerase-like enolase superfamily enzyme